MDWKRFMSFILTGCLSAAAILPGVAGMGTVVASAAESVNTCSTESQLADLLSNASTDSDNPTVIALTSDVSVNGQIAVKSGTYAEIESEGDTVYSIKETGTLSNVSSSGLLYVSGSLVVKNLNVDAAEKGRCIAVAPTGELTLDEGADIEHGADLGNASSNGLGICLMDGSTSSGAKLIIHDGAKISGCTAVGRGTVSEQGIGIYAGNYSRVVMDGGEVSGNIDKGNGGNKTPCTNGGGVYIQNYANFYMSGGTISGNSAYGGGGGVYIAGLNKSSIFTACGNAVIKENAAKSDENGLVYETPYGGGIYNSAGIVNISGNAEISDNTAYTYSKANYMGCGGGIFVNTGELNMSGGTVSGNTAVGYGTAAVGESTTYDNFGCGGGIFLKSAACNISGGSIENNSASSAYNGSGMSGNGGGIYLGFSVSDLDVSPSTLHMSGGTVTNNSAEKNGSGIFVADSIYSKAYLATTGLSSTSQQYCGTSAFFVSGSFSVKGNTGDNIFLSKEQTDQNGFQGKAELTLKGALSEDSYLGIHTEETTLDVTVAQPSDNYSIHYKDLGALHSDLASDSRTFEIDGDNQVVLAGGTSANRTDLSQADVEVPDVTYDGSAKKPDVTVTLSGMLLTKGTDYTVSYVNDVNAGTAVVTINGKGNYSGSVDAEFQINPYDISGSDVTVGEIPAKYYTGSAFHPDVKAAFKEKELTAAASGESGDYSLSYGENINPGEDAGTVIISGKGNFCGTRNVYFDIKNVGSVAVVTDESGLKSAIQASAGTAEEPAKIALGQDIAITSPIEAAAGKHLEIYGNGYSLSASTAMYADTSNPDKAMLQLCSATGSLEAANLTLSDLTLDGNNDARLLYVASGASLAVTGDSLLTEGKASSSSSASLGGQCIYNAGTTELDDCEIYKSVYGSYGCVFNASQAQLKLGDGCTIDYVVNSNGGAIYNAEGAVAEMDGTTIENAVGLDNKGSAITNYGTFTMNDGLITGTYSQRASIHNVGTFTMNGGKICNNTNTFNIGSNTYGGAVFNMTGTFQMKGGSITGNTAYEGGGVFVYSGSFIMDGETATISGNTCDYTITSMTNVINYGNGGGVYLYGGNFVLKNGMIKGNSVDYYVAQGKTPTVNGNGGGIYADGGSFVMDGGTIEENSASLRNTDLSSTQGIGGAVFVNGPSASAAVNGGLIENNSAGVVGTDGIYVSDKKIGTSTSGNGTLKLSGDAEINNGIYLAGSTCIDITGALSSSVPFRIYLSEATIGKCIAGYADLVSGEEEFAKASDASEFVCMNQSCTFEFVNREIIVQRADLTACTVSFSQEEYTYTGNAIKPQMIVSDSMGNVVTGYKAVYSNNINAGTASVTLTGDGYTATGVKTASFTITPKQLTADDITVDPVSNIYTGSAVEPDVTLTYGDITLDPYVYDAKTASYTGDYSLEYENNTDITLTAPAKAVVTGHGNYTGTAEKDFYIGLAQSMSGTATYTKTFGNTSFYLDTKVTAGEGTLSFSSNNADVAKVDASTGKVTVKGAGLATVTATVSRTAKYAEKEMKIKISVSKAAQSISGTSVYNKTYGDASFTLNMKRVSGNGALSYKSADTSVLSVSQSGKVTIRKPGRTTISVTAVQTENYRSAVRNAVITIKPSKSVLVSVKNNSGRKLAVQWKKDLNVTGYQIYYSSKSSFAASATSQTLVKNSKTYKKTISGLVKGKVYYVKIRSYKLVDGKALFSSFSSVKKIRIQK